MAFPSYFETSPLGASKSGHLSSPNVEADWLKAGGLCPVGGQSNGMFVRQAARRAAYLVCGPYLKNDLGIKSVNERKQLRFKPPPRANRAAIDRLARLGEGKCFDRSPRLFRG